MRWLDRLLEKATHRHALEEQILRLLEQNSQLQGQVRQFQQYWEEEKTDSRKLSKTLQKKLEILENDRTQLFCRLDEYNAKLLGSMQEKQKCKEWLLRLEESTSNMEKMVGGRLNTLESDRTELFHRLDGHSAEVSKRLDVLEIDRGELFRRLDGQSAQLEHTPSTQRLEVLETDRTELFRRLDQNCQQYTEGLWAQSYTTAKALDSLRRWVENPDRKPQRIHFVRCLDMENTGDLNCGPDLYFGELTQRYVCFFHSIKNINFHAIGTHDWVIIGGGGMLDCSQQYQDAINRLLSISDHVVSWGLGHNKHYKDNRYYWNPTTPIRYERFFLFTTRDGGGVNAGRFCPCVSCMMPGLEKAYKKKRDVGVLTHHAFPIEEFDFDVCNNSQPIEKILEFIGTSDTIITNTYHGAYWATLMNRKVIIYKKFSEKFDYFKYQPTEYSGNLQADIRRAKRYPNALRECRELNHALKEELIAAIDKG